MTLYYQPLVHTAWPRPDGAMALAGGWCWFSQVAVLSRGGETRIAPLSDIPSDILDRLTAPRTAIAGLAMNAPQVMGILNVTPDSFSDGGQYDDPAAAVAQALQMQADGATIIDIGGESTRPGAAFVPDDDEIGRTVPAIAALRAQSDVAISIDTRKGSVADAAFAAGATLLNDVAAFTFDPTLAKVTAMASRPVCLMHAQGDPATMQDDPQYENVLLDVYDFLADRVAMARAAGIPADQIIVDPGIGFGKTVAHNLTLLRGLSLFHGLGCPVLLGASRKRFIGTLGHAPVATDRVGGSVAVALWGLQAGVQITRVHDTLSTKQAFDLHMAMTRG